MRKGKKNCLYSKTALEIRSDDSLEMYNTFELLSRFIDISYNSKSSNVVHMRIHRDLILKKIKGMHTALTLLEHPNGQKLLKNYVGLGI